MSKSVIFALVGFVVGAAAGAVGSYLYLKKGFEERIDSEVQALHDIYDKETKEQRANEEVDIDDGVMAYMKEDERIMAEVAGDIFHSAIHENGEEYKKESSDYTVYSSEDFFRDEEDPAEREFPQDDEPEEDDSEDQDSLNERLGRSATEELQKNKKKRPFIIKSEEFGHCEGYGEETLYYYLDDGALVNEKDEEIDEYELMIGNALTKYGFDTNDEHSIYVRNPNLEMDYEIIKVYQAFSGLPDDAE